MTVSYFDTEYEPGNPDSPDWRQHAACRGHDPDLWFPSSGPRSAIITAQAQAICAGCPVQQACRQYADQRGDVYGIWGGHRYAFTNAYRNYRPFRTDAGLQPCGTLAAARRHARRGEPCCRACLEAQRQHRITRRKPA